MEKLDLVSMEAILWEIFKDKKSAICKDDVNSCELLPSYNTCCRWGLSLNKANRIFSERLYKSDPKKCKLCHTEIAYEKRINEFCGSSCAATFNGTGKVRKAETGYSVSLTRKRKLRRIQGADGIKPTIVITSNCLNCGEEILNEDRKYIKYCSDNCKQAYGFESRFRDWYELGKHFYNRPLRAFLSTLRGYHCEHCGISEWNGKPITLEVEHIDGNSGNSRPDNVCLLCPNCHSQTPTYKARNKGNGRHRRRIRYREGKSY